MFKQFFEEKQAQFDRSAGKYSQLSGQTYLPNIALFNCQTIAGLGGGGSPPQAALLGLLYEPV